MFSKESTTLFSAPSGNNAVTTNNSNKKEGRFTIPDWATEKTTIVGAAAVLGLILLTGMYCSLRVKQPH